MLSLRKKLLKSLTVFNECIALISDTRALTFGEIDSHSDAILNALITAGIKEGDHLGVYLKDPIDSIICFVAAIKMNQWDPLNKHQGDLLL